MPALLLAAALLAQAPAPAAAPPARIVAMGERLARSGTLSGILGAVGGPEARGVVDSHAELSPAQRAKALTIVDQALKDAAAELTHAEGVAFAQTLTPEQIKAAVIFFESSAGAAYRAAFPKVLAGVSQVGATKDFKGYVTQRLCAEAQVCPAPRK